MNISNKAVIYEKMYDLSIPNLRRQLISTS